MSEGETDKLLCRQTKLVCVCVRARAKCPRSFYKI